MTQTNISRQQQILNLLLDHESGLSIDDMALQLGISRNAVKQHLSGLEKQQLVREAALVNTGGRPARNYTLSEQGRNQFPKQYSWFSSLLLEALFQDLSLAEREQIMRDMALKLAESLVPDFVGKSLEAKLETLLKLMQSLGYHASLDATISAGGIKAANCVYHDLAQQYPEICQFDQALIESLLDRKVEQTACMAKQDCNCRFKLL